MWTPIPHLKNTSLLSHTQAEAWAEKEVVISTAVAFLSEATVDTMLQLLPRSSGCSVSDERILNNKSKFGLPRTRRGACSNAHFSCLIVVSAFHHLRDARTLLERFKSCQIFSLQRLSNFHFIVLYRILIGPGKAMEIETRARESVTARYIFDTPITKLCYGLYFKRWEISGWKCWFLSVGFQPPWKLFQWGMTIFLTQVFPSFFGVVCWWYPHRCLLSSEKIYTCMISVVMIERLTKFGLKILAILKRATIFVQVSSAKIDMPAQAT